MQTASGWQIIINKKWSDTFNAFGSNKVPNYINTNEVTILMLSVQVKAHNYIKTAAADKLLWIKNEVTFFNTFGSSKVHNYINTNSFPADELL